MILETPPPINANLQSGSKYISQIMLTLVPNNLLARTNTAYYGYLLLEPMYVNQI